MNSFQFHWIPSDFYELFRISWNSFGFLWILSNFIEFRSTPLNSIEFLWILLNFIEFILEPLYYFYFEFFNTVVHQNSYWWAGFSSWIYFWESNFSFFTFSLSLIPPFLSLSVNSFGFLYEFFRISLNSFEFLWILLHFCEFLLNFFEFYCISLNSIQFHWISFRTFVLLLLFYLKKCLNTARDSSKLLVVRLMAFPLDFIFWKQTCLFAFSPSLSSSPFLSLSLFLFLYSSLSFSAISDNEKNLSHEILALMMTCKNYSVPVAMRANDLISMQIKSAVCDEL